MLARDDLSGSEVPPLFDRNRGVADVEGDDEVTSGLMALEVSEFQGWSIITVVGELDISTASALRQAIAGVVDSGSRHVIVDLNGLRFMDSSGLNVFVGARRLLGPDGLLRIATVRLHIRKVFAISGIDRLIPLFDSVTEACGDAPPTSTTGFE
jgi:anti-sigma B factor antagonist